MKGLTFLYRFKGFCVNFVKNTMIRNERNKLKYLDCSNANEIMTKYLQEIFFQIFFPSTKNSIKGKSNHKRKVTP